MKHNRLPPALWVTWNFQKCPMNTSTPIVDQTMMDDYTLYEYLTDADTEIYK